MPGQAVKSKPLTYCLEQRYCDMLPASGNHRITGWLRLEETSQITQFQPPAIGKDATHQIRLLPPLTWSGTPPCHFLIQQEAIADLFGQQVNVWWSGTTAVGVWGEAEGSTLPSQGAPSLQTVLLSVGSAEENSRSPRSLVRGSPRTG